MRVVSLVPSATETLLAWGVDPVAVTRFCEQPGHEAVGGTKDPDVGRIVALAPDLVVVCDEENRAVDAEALVAAGLELFVFRARHVDDVPGELAALAERLGLPPGRPGTERGIPAGRAAAERGGLLRVFVPVWRRPWTALGPDTYGATLLAAAGAEAVVPVVPAAGAGPEPPPRYPAVDLADVAALAPDAVLAPDEPYPFGPRHRSELEQVAPVVFVDGKDLFWWGVRTPAARERLAGVVASLGP